MAKWRGPFAANAGAVRESPLRWQVLSPIGAGFWLEFDSGWDWVTSVFFRLRTQSCLGFGLVWTVQVLGPDYWITG